MQEIGFLTAADEIAGVVRIVKSLLRGEDSGQYSHVARF